MRNPIYTAERRHQKHVLDSNRSGKLWIGVAVLMLIPALLTALGAVGLTLAGVEIHEIPPETDLHRTLQSILNAGLILLIAMNVAQSLVVTLVASGLAAESVRREYRHHTWDLLVLTRQPARAIARGKITAAFWTLRRDVWFITILRLGLVAVAYEFFRQINQILDLAPLNQGHLIILLVLTVLWTFIDAFMAVGMAVAGAAAIRFGVVSLVFAIGLRLLALAGGVIWLVWVFNLMAAAPDQPDFILIGGIGLLVCSIAAYLSVLIAEIAVKGAGASSGISQPISQTPTLSASTP